LNDRRIVSVPLVWFPRLLAATSKQRKQWEPIGGGIGIHWEAIDEDISVASRDDRELKQGRNAGAGDVTSAATSDTERAPSGHQAAFLVHLAGCDGMIRDSHAGC
jgi:hypothetical protein